MRGPMPSLNVKDYLLAGACGLALLCLVISGVQTFRLSRAEEGLREAKARELQAQVQAALSEKVRTITETLHTKETIIRERADDAADQIRADSRGATPVDPGLLADWRRGLVGVREASGARPDPRAGEPAGEVSAP